MHNELNCRVSRQWRVSTTPGWGSRIPCRALLAARNAGLPHAQRDNDGINEDSSRSGGYVDPHARIDTRRARSNPQFPRLKP
jgi:hypothetical protein